MSAKNIHQQYKASSHFDHIPLLPSFYAFVSILKHCMVRILTTCGYWEVVDEVGTYCLTSNPGYFMLCLYYFAMLVDVDWL